MILVFDLDGTICFNGIRISDEILSALTILSNARNQLIFASARPIRDMLPLLTQFPYHFLIGGNGSIVRKNGQIEIVQPIENEDFEFIKKLIKQYDLDYLIDSDWNYSLFNRNDEKADLNNKVDRGHLAKNVPLSTLITVDSCFNGDNTRTKIIKCNLLNLTNFDILTELSNRNLEIVTHEHTASLDLTSRNINKYTTFKKYFPTANYIAFGNDANDVELLKHTDFSVAIGENSTLDFADEHLKADEITEFLRRWEYRS